jgi:uncharacterized protein with von Willebrand factor type A (vWA) domain
VLFGRVLRGAGLDVSPGRLIDLVRALELVEIGRREDFYQAARSLLVHRKDDLPLFDQAFSLFWRRHGPGLMTSLNDLRHAPPEVPETIFTLPTPEVETPSDPAGNGDDPEAEQKVIEITRTYSARERLFQKDFGEMTAAEIAAVKQLMAGFVWNLGERKTRRFRPGRMAQIDLRRSLRHNLRYGGEILVWPGREPRTTPRPLVLLADISGSMEQYSRLLVHFLYSIARALTQKVEVFVFGTRLTRITSQLKGRDVDAAVRMVSSTVTDWAGGTRIGDSLKTFNFDWGRRVLGRGAVVLVISDGWDRGEPDLLATEMARLQRSCYRLIWLNPLLGSVRYEPLTRGIQAALPHVHDFLPVHNLVSLETLALHLASLTEKRGSPRLHRVPGRGSLVSAAAFVR